MSIQPNKEHEYINPDYDERWFQHSSDDEQSQTSDTSSFIIDDSSSEISNFIIDDTSSIVSNFIIDDKESDITHFKIDNSSDTTEVIDPSEYTLEEYLISRLPKQIMLWTGEVIDIDGDNLHIIKYYLYKNKWLSPPEMIPLGQSEIIHYQNINELEGEVYDKLIENMRDNMKIKNSFKKNNKVDSKQLLQAIHDVSSKNADSSDLDVVSNWKEYLKQYNDKMEFLSHLTQYETSTQFLEYLQRPNLFLIEKIDKMRELKQFLKDPEFVLELERYTSLTEKLSNVNLQEQHQSQNENENESEISGNLLLWNGELLKIKTRDLSTVKNILKQYGPGAIAPRKREQKERMRKKIYEIIKKKFQENPEFRQRVQNRRKINEQKYRTSYKILREAWEAKAIHVPKEYQDRIKKLVNV